LEVFLNPVIKNLSIRLLHPFFEINILD